MYILLPLDYHQQANIKAEVIKWYRKLEELKESHYWNKFDEFERNFHENPVMVLRFLEMFHNIAGEDLKDEN